MLKKNHLIHLIVLAVTLQIIFAVVVTNVQQAEPSAALPTQFVLPTETEAVIPAAVAPTTQPDALEDTGVLASAQEVLTFAQVSVPDVANKPAVMLQSATVSSLPTVVTIPTALPFPTVVPPASITDGLSLEPPEAPVAYQRGVAVKPPSPAAIFDSSEMSAGELDGGIGALTCPSFPYTVPASDVANLINAISCATSNGTGTNDVINLTASSTYTLTAVNNTSVEGPNGFPVITNAGTNGTLTINGNGATITRSSAGGTPLFRLFEVASGAQLTLNEVALHRGDPDIYYGGAIYNNGTVSIARSTLAYNHTSGAGGAIFNAATLSVETSSFWQNASSDGGAIFNDNQATVINSTFADNTGGYGGAITNLNTLVLRNSTIAENEANTQGGGIDNVSIATVSNTIIANNSSTSGAPDYNGFLTSEGYNIIGDPTGTAIFGTTTGNQLNVSETQLGLFPLGNNGGPTSTFSLHPSSVAVNAGDPAFTPPPSTDQRGQPRVQAGRIDVGAYESYCPPYTVTIAASDTATLIRAIECSNANDENDVINLTNSTYEVTAVNNNGTNGPNGFPVIVNDGGHTLTINGNGATITRSYAEGTPLFRLFEVAGGEITLNEINLHKGDVTGVNGGAIFNNGSLSIVRSTLAYNHASGSGGAIYNLATLSVESSTLWQNYSNDGGAIFNATNATVVNSTFASNTAALGGAISNVGTLTVRNSTLAENGANLAGGGINNEASATISNTIIAKNFSTSGPPDYSGTLNSLGYNVIANPTGATITGTTTGNLLNVTENELGLLPLGTSGGPTLTMSLHPSSVAVNAGDPAFTAPPSTDQRGQPRVQAGRMDIGAYESYCPPYTTTIPAGDTATLIRAIECSNANDEDDVINLTLSTYTLTAIYNPTDGPIGLPVIADDLGHTLTINGPARITRSIAGGTPSFRLLQIASGANVILNNLSLDNGKLSNEGGAAIMSFGTLAINRSSLSGNQAFTAAGAVLTSGPLTIDSSTFYNNIADSMGGALFNQGATVTITNSTFTQNSAYDGGAIYNTGTVTVKHSTIADNTAGQRGGAIYQGGLTFNLGSTIVARNTAVTEGADIFGAVTSQGYNLIGNTSSATITGSTTGNLTNAAAQPLNLAFIGDFEGPTPTMPLNAGSVAINAGDPAFAPPPSTDQTGRERVQNGRIDIGAYEAYCPNFPVTIPATDKAALIKAIECSNINNSSDVINLTAGTYSLNAINNTTNGNNGLPVIGSDGGHTLTINGNGAIIARATGAPGIPALRFFHVASGATLTLNDLTLSTGRVNGDYGGAIYNLGTLSVNRSRLSGNRGVSGGAIYNAGTLSLDSSTISGNSGDYAGGIDNENTATVINSTIASNTATNFAGGLYNAGVLTVTQSTIASNTATEGGGIYNFNFPDSVFLANTIVASNTGSTSAPDLYGPITSQGYNLIGNTSGATINGTTTGNLINADAQPLNLGALANNGGPTLTRALGVNSVAINAGNPSFAPPPNFDQRGTSFPRVSAGRVDIGAFEYVCPTFPYTVPAANPNELIKAVFCANLTPANDVINLTNSTYTLSTVNSTTVDGDAGLPTIKNASTAGTLTINGNGATIRRSTSFATPSFRLINAFAGSVLRINNVTLFNGRTTGSGGAIMNRGWLTIADSLITGNRAAGGGGIASQSANLLVINSTFTNNQATDAYGGAMVVSNQGTWIINSTITGNSALYDAGGIQTLSDVKIYNTIIANNTGAAECSSYIFATLTISNTLIKDGSCGISGGVSGNLSGDPSLGAQAGSPGYFPLTSASIAINAGSSSFLSEATVGVDFNGDGDTADTLAFDQRGAGFPRVVGSSVDMGAVESEFLVIDPIFSDSFEGGSLSAWTSSTTDGGNLSVTTLAELSGSRSMQALINDNNSLFVTDGTPNAEARYRARFYFDPNSLSMANNDNFVLLYGLQSTSTVALQLQLRRSGSLYQARVGVLLDDGSTVYTGYATVNDAPNLIELDWQAASAVGANNGSLTLWVNETQQPVLSGLDNDTRRIDNLRLGAVSGVDNGTRGTMYFDAFVSRRGSYIGPILPAPALLNPADGAQINEGAGFNLAWSNVAGAAHYYVELTNGSTVNVNSGWQSPPPFWIVGAQPPGSYTWRVKARDAAGAEGFWSTPRTVNVRPAPASNLQVPFIAEGQVGLMWTASTTASDAFDGYAIYRDGVMVGTVDSNSTTYSDTDVSTCVTYQYTVRAYIDNAESTDSNTVSPVMPCHSIFSDSFESGGFGLWTSSFTDGGNLSVTSAAGMSGAQGMQTLINDNNSLYVTDDTPSAEALYRVFFYFDPNSITMANNDNFVLLYGLQGTSSAVLQLQLRRSGSLYQVRVGTMLDNGTTVYTGYTTISDAPNAIEIDWQSANPAGDNNGVLTWWLNDVKQGQLLDLDNDTRRIDRARLGAVSGVDTGTRGTIYFDAFVSQRLQAVGMAGVIPLVPALNTPANNASLTGSTTLTWQTALGATEYYAELTDGESIAVNSGWISGTSWTPGAQPAGMYTWHVKARNTVGESPFGEERTLQSGVSAPSNLQGTPAATQINLTWVASPGAPTGIDGYHIYREGALAGTVGNSVASFADTGLLTCTSYHYVVRAYLGAAESADSNTLTISTICDTLFSDGFEGGSLNAWTSKVIDGGNLSATAGAALSGSFGMQALINDANPLYVTDGTPNAEARYRARFYFDPNSLSMANNDNFVLLYGLQGTSTVALQLQFRRSGSLYQVRVGVLLDNGSTVYTGYATVSDAPNLIELDWQAASAVGANNGSLTLWVNETQQPVLSGLDTDTRRIDNLRLGAVTGIDAGTSGTIYFDAFISTRTTYIGYLLPAPALTSPADGAAIVSGSAPSLAWNAVPNASQYRVEFTNGSSVNLLSDWNTTTSPYSPGVQPAGTYTWRVKARLSGSLEESPWSAVRTLIIRPAAPSNLQGTPAATQINLTWAASPSAPAGIEGYHIYREGALVGTTNSTTALFNDTTAASCTTYHYVVRAYLGAAESADSNTLTISTICDTLFSDGFEGGNLNAWTSKVIDGGNLSATAGAALSGSFGMQALINDANPLYVTDGTPNAEARYRARFYFDPNSLSMANNDNFVLLYGLQSTSTVALQLQFRRSGSLYQVRVGVLLDDGSTVYTGYATVSDAPNLIELDWQAASAVGANNGSLTLWVNETQQPVLSGLDNDTRRIDNLRLGAVTGIDAGTSGTIYFDAFASTRTTYIGPELGGLSFDFVDDAPVPTETPAPTDEPTVIPTPEVEPTQTITPDPAPTETPAPAYQTVEAEDAAVVRAADWLSMNSLPAASGGSYLVNTSMGGSLSLTFTGKQAEISYISSPSFGTFEIDVDGMVVQVVDSSTAAEATVSRVSVSLSDGIHTLSIIPRSSIVAIDAFLITGSIVPPATPTETTPTETATPEATLPAETPTEPPTEPGIEPTLAPFTLPLYQTMDDGAPLWTGSSNWQLRPEVAYNGLGWLATGSGQVETLRLLPGINLGTAQNPVLSFQSRLTSPAQPEVQVSLDGVNWQTVMVVQPSDEWTQAQASLAAYAGQTVYLQFVWLSSAPSEAGDKNSWQVDEVIIADAAVTFEPVPTEKPDATGTAPTFEPPAPRDGLPGDDLPPPGTPELPVDLPPAAAATTDAAPLATPTPEART